MSRHREIERRIDRILMRAARKADRPLLHEMEDVLASGYASALEGDARCRRLRRRLDALADAVAEEGVASEVRRLTLEHRTVEESTRRLRARLESVRRLFIELGGARR